MINCTCAEYTNECIFIGKTLEKYADNPGERRRGSDCE
jgi:hypothetical protein